MILARIKRVHQPHYFTRFRPTRLGLLFNLERPRTVHPRCELHAFGQLDTNPHTVKALHQLFMKNIHLLHPFLDEVVLDLKIKILYREVWQEEPYQPTR